MPACLPAVCAKSHIFCILLFAILLCRDGVAPYRLGVIYIALYAISCSCRNLLVFFGRLVSVRLTRCIFSVGWHVWLVGRPNEKCFKCRRRCFKGRIKHTFCFEYFQNRRASVVPGLTTPRSLSTKLNDSNWRKNWGIKYRFFDKLDDFFNLLRILFLLLIYEE